MDHTDGYDFALRYIHEQGVISDVGIALRSFQLRHELNTNPWTAFLCRLPVSRLPHV
jgi:hypothetical protein